MIGASDFVLPACTVGDYSIVGGGDTISAATKAGILDSINYLSTAGGAFLEYLEGKSLPALLALKKKSIPVEIVSSHYVDPKGERVRS